MLPLPPYPEFNELAASILFVCGVLATLPPFLIFRNKANVNIALTIIALAIVSPFVIRFLFPWITIRGQNISECYFYPGMILSTLLMFEWILHMRRKRMARDEESHRNSLHNSG